jgi:hypothetical protein
MLVSQMLLLHELLHQKSVFVTVNIVSIMNGDPLGIRGQGVGITDLSLRSPSLGKALSSQLRLEETSAILIFCLPETKALFFPLQLAV